MEAALTFLPGSFIVSAAKPLTPRTEWNQNGQNIRTSSINTFFEKAANSSGSLDCSILSDRYWSNSQNSFAESISKLSRHFLMLEKDVRSCFPVLLGNVFNQLLFIIDSWNSHGDISVCQDYNFHL